MAIKAAVREQVRQRANIELENGLLFPLTTVAAFTLRRLRLNRQPLVAHRLRKQHKADEARLLRRYRDLAQLSEQLLLQQSALMEEQRQLLEEQRALLQLILGRK